MIASEEMAAVLRAPNQLCYCLCFFALFVTYFVHNVSATVSISDWPSRQSYSVQCLCSFAHLNILFLLASQYQRKTCIMVYKVDSGRSFKIAYHVMLLFPKINISLQD